MFNPNDPDIIAAITFANTSVAGHLVTETNDVDQRDAKEALEIQDRNTLTNWQCLFLGFYHGRRSIRI